MTRKSVPVAAVLSLIEKWEGEQGLFKYQSIHAACAVVREKYKGRVSATESCITELRALLPATRK